MLQTDASIKNLCACLLQDEKPVYFASKALTNTQNGYVAIELESLAVAWATEKFHHFLYASHFILEAEQKPLGQEVPLHPWSKLATDIFHFEETSYILIVDYTSRFPVVYKLSSMTGQHVANQCKLIFSEYGWPETLISDNISCYTSEAFTSLMQNYSMNHITSSPNYLQSNGLTEKIVQIVKSSF